MEQIQDWIGHSTGLLAHVNISYVIIGIMIVINTYYIPKLGKRLIKYGRELSTYKKLIDEWKYLSKNGHPLIYDNISNKISMDRKDIYSYTNIYMLVLALKEIMDVDSITDGQLKEYKTKGLIDVTLVDWLGDIKMDAHELVELLIEGHVELCWRLEYMNVVDSDETNCSDAITHITTITSKVLTTLNSAVEIYYDNKLGLLNHKITRNFLIRRMDKEFSNKIYTRYFGDK